MRRAQTEERGRPPRCGKLNRARLSAPGAAMDADVSVTEPNVKGPPGRGRRGATGRREREAEKGRDNTRKIVSDV